MNAMLVRLKPHDPRRGFVLRRYTYRGIKFHHKRGWYRVDKDVAAYLRGVRQAPGDHTPLAFDVVTEDEAKALEASEAQPAARKAASDPVEARTNPPTADVDASEPSTGIDSKRRSGRSK